MDKKRLKKYKEMLLSKREQIVMDVKEMAKSTKEPSIMAQDLGDRALSSYEKELMYQLSDAEIKLLVLVVEALERMDKGGYGQCVECSSTIQEPRLNAIPWARHCIHCQEKQEKGLIP